MITKELQKVRILSTQDVLRCQKGGYWQLLWVIALFEAALLPVHIILQFVSGSNSFLLICFDQRNAAPVGIK